MPGKLTTRTIIAGGCTQANSPPSYGGPLHPQAWLPSLEEKLFCDEQGPWRPSFLSVPLVLLRTHRLISGGVLGTVSIRALRVLDRLGADRRPIEVVGLGGHWRNIAPERNKPSPDEPRPSGLRRQDHEM